MVSTGGEGEGIPFPSFPFVYGLWPMSLYCSLEDSGKCSWASIFVDERGECVSTFSFFWMDGRGKSGGILSRPFSPLLLCLPRRRHPPPLPFYLILHLSKCPLTSGCIRQPRQYKSILRDSPYTFIKPFNPQVCFYFPR